MIQSLRSGLRQSGAPLCGGFFDAGLKPDSNPNGKFSNKSNDKSKGLWALERYG